MKKFTYAIMIAFTILLAAGSALAANLPEMEVRYANGSFALKAPGGYRLANVLSANTAESITVPTNTNGIKANYVVFSANCDFYVDYSGTATVPAADITDGTADQLNPTTRYLGGIVTTISVISASSCIVVTDFFK